MPSGPAAVAVDLLQVEEERLDHVLRDLAGHEVDEVAALDLDRVVEVDLRALDRRGHDVVRRRVVRALELLAQVGRERRQVLRELRVRRRAAGDLVALDVPRLAGGLAGCAAIHALAAGTSSSRVATTSSTRPSSLALAGRRRWPCSSSCISASTMPSMRTVRTTPPAPGSSPSWTSGKPSSTFGSSTTMRWWRGEADLQAAAERGAVDRGDDRLAERLQAAQLRLAVAHALGELARRRPCVPRLQVVEVAAGEEGLLGGGDDDARDRRPSRPRGGRPSRPSTRRRPRSSCWPTGSGRRA